MTGSTPSRIASWALLTAVLVGLLLLGTLFVGDALAATDGSGATPTIASDKGDYLPGETVTLTGAGWEPAETVAIVVNDDQGRTWSHSADVVADEGGNVADQFQLPNWFVAVYSVTATGSSSGTIVSSFTDAALKTTIVGAVPSLLGSSNAFTDVTWNANGNGTYSVRVAGSSCTTGTQVEAGSYTTQPSNVTTRILAISLAEGANTVRVCVTAAGSTDFDTIVVTKDTAAPAAPTVSSTNPVSPANNNAPKVIGSAEAASTVRLYTNATCTSAIAATGTAATFASPGLTVAVGDGVTTTFYATATDAAGNVSACSSSSVTYVEDSVAPGMPTVTGVSPASPSSNNNPTITGSAEAGTTVKLYTNATCTSGVAATGTAAAFASPGLTATVSNNSTTTYYATASDAAGNASACSTSSVTYVEDSAAPGQPNLTTTNPASPANNNSLTVIGTAEAGSTITLYANSTCTTNVVATGTAATLASPGLAVSVLDNTSTAFRATATDAAGNVSGCSSAITYVEDSAAPVAPTVSSTNPVSPANNMAPKIMGGAEAGSTVKLYTDATCTSAVAASGTAAAFGGTGLTVAVGDNTSTTFYATATDAAGNTSGCSTSSVTYVEDSVAPAAPTFTATDPTSPSGNNSPKIIGSAEAGSTVKLYTNATCTSGVAATGTAATFASPGIVDSVTANTSTAYRATATDAAGNVSACSTSTITYVEDSTAPAPPTLTATSPASPANNNSPNVIGSAESGSTVKLYTNSTCTSAVAATGTAAAFASPGLAVSVADGTSTAFRATATDAAGNVSACSTSTITYVEDSAAPVAPSVTSSSPASPANNNAPKIIGSAEAGSTVKLYTNATCTSAVAGSGTAAVYASPGLTVAVADDTTTTFYATATDASGNVSACSSSSVTYVEDSTAAAPSVTSSSPASPANNNAPRIIGSAESGSTVKLYTNATCTSAVAATGTAAAFASPGLTVAVTDGSTTTYYATATDGVGNVSACSTSSITYVEDSLAPARPTVTATSPASPANDNFPEILGSAEAGSTVRLYTDATCTSVVAATGTANAFASPGLTVSVGDGTTTSFYATATDAAGNVSACSSTSVTYVEDSAPPAHPTLTASSPASPSSNNAPRIIGSAESGSTVTLYTDATCTSPVAGNGGAAAFASPGLTVTVADDTTTRFYATATDAVGNVSSCSSSFVTYVEDSTAPDTALGSTPTDPSNVASPTLTFSSSETGSTFQCRLDGSAGGPFTTCSSPDTIGPLADGTHTFDVRAVDAAGNTDATPASYTWIVDTQKPASAAASPAYSTSTTFTVSYSASDSGSGLDSIELWAKAPGEDTFSKVATDESPSAGGSFSYSAGAGDGSYAFYTVAVDTATNREAPPASSDASTFLDTHAPSSSASSPAYNATGTITVDYTASDAESGLKAVELWAKGPGDADYSKVATDATPGATGSFSYSASDGSYSFYTRALDKAGNYEAAPSVADSSTLVDLGAPTSAATSPAYSTATTITVSYTASDVGSGLDTVELWAQAPGDSGFSKVATDSSPGTSGTFSYAAGADGSYGFYTVAVDAAGNSEAAPAGADATTLVDTGAPSSSAGSPAFSTATTFSVGYTDSDSGSGVGEVQLWVRAPGEGTFSKVATDTTPSASGSFSYSATAGDGTYGFYTVAVDAAGNVEAAPAGADTQTLLDTAAANSSASSPAYSTSTTISVGYTASESGSGLHEVELWAKPAGESSFTKVATDTAPGASGTFTYDATAGDGSYGFYTVAIDTAGNVEAAPATADTTTLLDTGVPSSSASSPTYSASTTIAVGYSAVDPGTHASGLDTVELWAKAPGEGAFSHVATASGTSGAGSFSYSSAAGDGAYAFYTVAADKAGNREAAPETADTMTLLDTAAPRSSASSPTYSASTTIAVAYAAGDTGSGLHSVELWAQTPGSAVFSKVATDSTPGADGSFSYSAVAGDGAYAFFTVAVDRAGNREADPAGADTTTVLDTGAPSSAATSPVYSTATTITVSYTASDAGSGVDSLELWAKGPGELWYTKVATTTAPLATGSFSYLALAGDGTYGFYTVARDAAGNAEDAPATADTTTLLDTSVPASSATSPAYDRSATITVSYSAFDAGANASGLDSVELWAQAPSVSGFTKVATDATPNATGSFAYDAAAGDGAYGFYTVAVDKAGNREGAPAGADTTTFVDTVAPNTAITAHPNDPTASTSATFEFSTSDAAPSSEGLQVECSLDGAAFTACTSPTSFSDLADGSHTFEARAIDNAGNTDGSPASFTWTIDTVAPSTTIMSHPSDPSASSAAAFEFNATDPNQSSGGIHFECSLDGGAFEACESPKSYSDLADGSHTFSVQARDAAGNVDATPATFTWFVDTISPTTSITGHPTDPTASSSASFTFSGADATPSSGGIHFECSLDGSDYEGCTSPRDYSGLADGTHTMRVRAADAAGNVDSTPAGFTWLVDTTAPDTNITSEPDDPTASSSASFAFNGSDPAPSSGGLRFECSLDGSGFEACASAKSYSGLADGSHTFKVRALDAVGNTDATPDAYTWFVDTVAPDTSITSHPSDPSGSSSASFAFTGSDPVPSSGGVHFECSLDGSAFSSCESAKTYSGLADGSHTFAVRAIDKATNTDSTPETFGWFVDTVAPNASITGHPSDPSGSSSASFAFTGSDPAPSSGGLHFACSIDGGAFSSCSTGKTYSGLVDGSHTFQVKATDAAGNTGPAASFGWTVDTIAPDTTIGSKPSDPSTSTDATFTFTSTETGSSFRCSLDGAAFATCPASYSGLAQGTHTFQVAATDAAGNTDATPASYTWKIDSIAPDTTITSYPANPTTATNASFAFTATESGSSFKCSLDSAAFVTCTSPKDYTGLSLGNHTFQVKATDVAGNTDATPASYTWTVKGIPPTVTSTTPSGTGVSVLANATATFSRAMDASTITTSSFTLTPSGGSPVAATVSCNNPCTTATLKPSSQLASSTVYTAQVTTGAKAGDGTPLASPVSWSFTTGNSPEVASKSPSNGASNVPTGSDTGTPVNVTFTRAMNGNTFTTSTFTLWRPDNTQVPALPSYNAATNTASILPTLPLSHLTTYTVKLTSGVTDANGVPLAPVSWTFTTTGTMTSKRINVGATTPYTDSFGKTWLADDFFKNGFTESFPTRTISTPAGYDPAIFRDDRYGSSATAPWSYNIPMPNGTYDIKLYFVELTKTGIGQRVFSVDIVDTPGAIYDVNNLDIYREVGANAADVKTFVDVPIVDSTLSLKSYVGIDLPELAAIEIIPKHT